MKLSRNMKQNGGTSIIAILTVIAHAFMFMYGGGIEYANTVELESQDIVFMLEQSGNDVVPVKFQQGMVVESNAKLHLMGGLSLDARPGDVVIFRKDDGVWTETYRALTEGLQ